MSKLVTSKDAFTVRYCYDTCNNCDTLLHDITAESLHAFEVVCSQMLEDVQERLVYRTHIYIRHEILNYKPADGDLAYPDKLQMMEVRGHVWLYSALVRSPSVVLTALLQ